MSLTYQILQLSDLDRIQNFERSRSAKSNDSEPVFAEWTAAWRRESLEHYLPLGWSFGFYDQQEKLLGYFLGQPSCFSNSKRKHYGLNTSPPWTLNTFPNLPGSRAGFPGISTFNASFFISKISQEKMNLKRSFLPRITLN